MMKPMPVRICSVAKNRIDHGSSVILFSPMLGQLLRAAAPTGLGSRQQCVLGCQPRRMRLSVCDTLPAELVSPPPAPAHGHP